MPEIHVKESITINCKAGDIYRFWSNFENLSLFIDHLDSVEDLGQGHNRWTIKTPVGPISWESEIIENKKNELIRWRSVPDSLIKNSGFLSLIEKQAHNVTEATVELCYNAAHGHDSFLEEKMIEIIVDVTLKRDLEHLKNIMETA
jgi:uncharacterized membrane protein